MKSDVKRCATHPANCPMLGCTSCEAFYDNAIAELELHGFAKSPTARSRALATFALAYAGHDYASGAGLAQHRQVVAAHHRSAEWCGEVRASETLFGGAA